MAVGAARGPSPFLSYGSGKLTVMHAITIDQPGGPDALVWAEVPDPTAGPGEVVIEVTAP